MTRPAPSPRSRSRRRRGPLAVLAAVLLLGACTSSTAAPVRPTSTTVPPGTPVEPTGTQHLSFSYGPIDVAPGQNNITFSRGQVPKPTEAGWIVGIAPNIRYADGSVPPVDVIHLHHGVWLNVSRRDATRPSLPERFFAAGEEKTVTQLPMGFGYQYRPTDNWVINYMVHNLLPDPKQVSITYDIDFLPATAPAAGTMKPARPLWLDVQNGSAYPVFDVLKGSGPDGTFTYPDQAVDPYHGKGAANVWTVDRPGTLISVGGHLHPGGLHDDLYLQRPGQPAAAHLFRSEAHYWEPAGAVSWDVATTVAATDWRVAVQPGDVLRLSSTYDSARASWYESMGIMVAWMADGTSGADPFTTPVDGPGRLTHGHLPENDHHGGTGSLYPDPRTRPGVAATGPVTIADFTYAVGDMGLPGAVPTVKRGQPLTFSNADAPTGVGIWHSITACRAPCNQDTGIAYPLADADVTFDSGQLGVAGPPTAGRVDWKTPVTLADGQYTYFCRIHPFMRGSFDVVGP